MDSPRNRDFARAMIAKVPDNWVCIFQPEKRNSEQNKRLWGMLSDIAGAGLQWAGQYWGPAEWKDITLSGFLKVKRDEREAAQPGSGGAVARVIPGIEGEVLTIGLLSSALDKPTFAEYLTYIDAWGSARGVVWSDPTPKDEPPAQYEGR